MDTQEMEAPAIPLAECDQFICFIDLGITGIEETDRFPVGVGKTRADALEMGIRNGLPKVAGAGYYALAQSSFATVAQPQLTAEEFAAVGKTVTDFFSEKENLRTTPE